MDAIIDQRRSALRDQLAVSEVDTLLIFSGENRRYLSGFTAEDGEGYESAGTLILTRDRQLLATDSRYDTQAREEAAGYEVVCYKAGLSQLLPEILKDLNTHRLGFEAGGISYAGFKKISQQVEKTNPEVVFVDADGMLADIRSCKDTSELSAIQRALDLAEAAFGAFLADDLAPGISEKDAAWMIEKRMRKAGADGLAFPVIAAFGENSALPHAQCGDKKLEVGQPILLDWGAKIDGYCSDISRSFVLGKADSKYKKVHRTVYEAQQRAIATVKPGVAARTVDAVARDYIDKAGFKDKFGHGLGHGVGLAVHEAPRVSFTSEAILEEGMVFTVEPGIYLPGWGGVRVENMVVVRADGAEVLNRSASDFIEKT